MSSKPWINVILATDNRLDDAQRCIESIRKFYGITAPIALASYGNIYPQTATFTLAKYVGWQYLHVPPFDFLTDDDKKEWHTIESLARVYIVKYFSDMGYDEIYILHADAVAIGDYRAVFNSTVNGLDYSFAGGIYNFTGDDILDTLQGVHDKFPSAWDILIPRIRVRWADSIMRYNPVWVDELYNVYGDERAQWDKYFSKFSLFHDISYFDVARDWQGFRGVQVGDVAKDKYGPFLDGTMIHKPRGDYPEGTAMTWGKGTVDLLQRNRARRCGGQAN